MNNLIGLILVEWDISFKYRFDLKSNTHLFKVLDSELFSSDSFQDFISEEIYKLIKEGMYQGICFIEPDDKTISFKKSKLYTSKSCG